MRTGFRPLSRGGFLRPEGERPPVDAEKLREGGAAPRRDRDGAAVALALDPAGCEAVAAEGGADDAGKVMAALGPVEAGPAQQASPAPPLVERKPEAGKEIPPPPRGLARARARG